MASGAAATTVFTAFSRFSMPCRKPRSLKKPWSMATSKQRLDRALNRRLARYVFIKSFQQALLPAVHTEIAAVRLSRRATVPPFGHPAQRLLQFGDSGGLVQDAVHVQRQVLLSFHQRGPAGHHDDRRGGRFLFEDLGQLTTIEMRHAQISNDSVKWFAVFFGGPERVQSALAAIGDVDLVAVAFQNFLEQFAQQRFVTDEQNSHRRHGHGSGWAFDEGGLGGFAHREDQAHGGAFTGPAVDFDGAVVTLYHAINHRQTKAGAELSFG